MNIDKFKVEENIYIFDVIRDFNICGNINNFIKIIDNAVLKFNIKNVVIDFIIGFFEFKEIYVWEIVRIIYNFLKLKKFIIFMIL